MKKLKLKRELRQIGASPSEAADLARLAGQLGGVKLRGLSAGTRDEIARIPGKRVHYFHIPARYAMGGALAAVIVLVGVAQTAKPGSALYNVKRGTEEVRAIVQPGYVDTLVEERKTEVEQLKQEQATPEKVEKAERDYEKTRERSQQRRQNNGDNKQQDEDSPNTNNRRGRGQRSDGGNSTSGSRQSDNDGIGGWWRNSGRR